MKRECNQCKETKDLNSGFYKRKEGKYGRSAICKTCAAENQRAWVMKRRANQRARMAETAKPFIAPTPNSESFHILDLRAKQITIIDLAPESVIKRDDGIYVILR